MSEFGKLIDGVKVTELKVHHDARGSVMKMMSNADPNFEQFGEIYFSSVNQDAVKAWHVHRSMTLNYAVVIGKINLVLYDERSDSPTFKMVNTFMLDGWPVFENYYLVTIPPDVWNGFRQVLSEPLFGAGKSRFLQYGEPAIVANCATEPHDPDEIERVHPEKFPLRFGWGNYKVAG